MNAAHFNAAARVALSVNVNKVALLRNSRHLGIPSVTRAAELCLQAGAQGITIHPRPDERHIRASDVAELAAQAVAAPAQGFFNVGSGEHTTLLELARTVAALPGIGAALEIEPAAAGAFGGFPAIAIDKARATFGFAPRPLAAGRRDYRDFLRRTAP